MTLSERILSALLLLALLNAPALAADPPEAAMVAAGQAIETAARGEPQGPAADLLAQARERFDQANAAIGRRKHRDALRLAEQARALAVRADAQSRLFRARAEVEDKTNRNANLRRELQMAPGARP